MLKKGAKILFISRDAGFIGGLEKYIFDVSNLLRENGFKTHTLYVQKTNGAEKYLSAFDATTAIEDIDSISESDFDLTTLHKISDPKNLKVILERFSPTVFVHDHDYFCPKGYKYFPYKRINCTRPYCGLFCGVCASIVPPRHLKNGLFAMLKKNFSDSYKLNSLIKTCKNFVVLSQFMKGELVANSIAPSAIKVIQPFLTKNYEVAKSDSDKFEIVVACQQVMSKGTPYLLDAIKLCKSNVHLNILGAGPRLEDFKKMAQDLQLDGKVDFRAWVDNPQDFFKRADIAVFPSMWQEPFGLSGIEAMAMALPVVGFDVGGVSQWLKDGKNGILVKPRDSQKMAEAIDKLNADAPLRKSMGTYARQFVIENFSSKEFLENFVNLK